MVTPRLAGRLTVALVVALHGVLAHPAEEARLFTGPRQTTQYQVGGELIWHVAPFTDMPLELVPAAGPADILQQLRDASRKGGGLELALLQADLAQIYLLAAEQGNAGAAAWLAPLRVVAPLYSEELHFVVRSDSPFETVADIRGARIDVGPVNGGTALSVATLYRLLFDAAVPPDQLSRLGPKQALAKLLTDRSIDVVALLADQPAPLLAKMKPEARRFVRLLKFDRDAASATVQRVYGVSALRATSYPNLLDEDVPALAVRLYLVAHGQRDEEDAERLRRLAGAYCQELPHLKSAGHPKWLELEAGMPALAPGWHYARAAATELARCLGVAETAIPDTCLPQEQALGLCASGAEAPAAASPAAAAAPR